MCPDYMDTLCNTNVNVSEHNCACCSRRHKPLTDDRYLNYKTQCAEAGHVMLIPIHRKTH